MIYVWKCPQCKAKVRTSSCCPYPQCCGGFDMDLVEQYTSKLNESIIKGLFRVGY